MRECKQRLAAERLAFPHFFDELEKQQAEETLKKRHHSRKEDKDYVNAIGFVRKNIEKIPLNLKTVQKLHTLICPSKKWSGTFKSHNNFVEVKSRFGNGIVRCVPAYLCAAYMEKLDQEFKKAWKSKRYDPLILISAYILDFFQIHPFFDGNGRTARLIYILLLHQAGHEIPKYINFENMVRKKRFPYERPLFLANIHWKKKKHDLFPSCEYLADTVLSAYQQIERKISKMKASS